MIERLEDLIDEYKFPEIPIRNMIKRMNIEVLTPLQKTAFNTKEFWNRKQNILIQGATSSGKTLVSEILALDCMKSQNKIIYLAPLRAMVAEKYEQFRKDFATYSDSVYASSSDYLMNDEDIVAGAFDMAVIVYEKFFAMLTEDNVNSRMMSECGLIIVDELQMLSVDQRGSKLEFAIAKILENRPDIRIVGLTTCYSDIDDLKDWLEPAKIIKNNDRMLPMVEHVICCTDGKYISKYNPAIREYYLDSEMDCDSIMQKYEQKYSEGKRNPDTLPCIGLPEYGINKAKLNTLRQILQKEFKERHQSCKAIIFTHSKRNARFLATSIADLFERRMLNHDLVTELNNLDDGEDIQEMRDHLFTYGVAYHYSSLSAEARQLIEEQFSRHDGVLNVIIATETLAIGVNLPADTIVVYDNEVMKSNCKERLEPQAYKNYIGRAGRFGISSSTEATSYLIASTKNQMLAFCERYIEAKPCRVKSSYSENTSENQAPFVLNGLPAQEFTEEKMQKLLDHTMYSQKNIEHTKEILNKLEEYELVNLSGPQMFGGPKAKTSYTRTEVGVALAPFALSMQACWIIRTAFYKKEGYTNGALPDSYSESDLKNEKYMLDILYLVCMMPEVMRLNAPSLPTNTGVNPEPYIRMRNTVKEYLQKRVRKNPDVFWENSIIKETFFNDQFDLNNVHAIVKAILMELWIKGNTIEDIRKNTGFTFRVNIGDLDHLGDVVSYLVEAISKVVDYNDTGNKKKLMRPFYQMSRRIRYGADSDMVRILNCHVRGIGRYKVIRLIKALGKSDKYGDLLDFFRHAPKIELEKFHFTEKQRNELCAILNRKYNHGSVKYRVDELYYDNVIDQRFAEAHSEYMLDETTGKFINLLKSVDINVTSLCILGYSDLIYTISFGNHQIPVILLADDKKVNDYCTLSDVIQYQSVIDILNQKIVFVSPNDFNTDINDYARFQSNIFFITRRALVDLLIGSLPYRSKNQSESIFFKVLEGSKGIMDAHSVQMKIKEFDKCSPPKHVIMDVFLSYAHSEGIESEVVEFASKLREKGVSYFFDTVSIRKGDHFVKVLDQGLSSAKVFVLFVNTRYGKTNWTCEEMYSAIKAQIEKERRVIPMIFDEEGRAFWEQKALSSAINYQDCTIQSRRQEIYENIIGEIMKELHK